MSSEAIEFNRRAGLRLPAEDSASEGESGSHRKVLAGVLICFFLSGFAALLYQTAWLREFSLVFGAGEVAAATVLAAYMGGLAAGAALSGCYARRVRRPILAYALLEAGIAVSAVAVPLLSVAAGAAYTRLLGGLPELPDGATMSQPLLYLVVAFVVLAVPTALMGATLPLLTNYAVRSNVQLGQKVAILYSINTLGAAAGAVAAAFVLLPALGLTGTVWVGVALNAVIFLVAASLARRAASAGDAITGASTDGRHAAAAAPGFFAGCLGPLSAPRRRQGGAVRAAFQRQPAWILPLMLVSGATSFFYEVLWTRMLAHVIGGSVYAFATMLAAFLSGIAIGAGCVGKAAADRNRAGAAFAAAQAAIALVSIAVYAFMQALLPEARGGAASALYAVAVLLPAAVFVGATFPLAVRILAENERQVGSATARVYAWSTIGAIAGVVLAGLWLIPALGFEGSIKLAVAVNSLIALATAALVLPPRRLPIGAAAALLLGVALAYAPGRPRAVIAAAAFPAPEQEGPEIFFAVGRSATVLVTAGDGKLDVRTNGLPQASVLPEGALPLADTQYWMHALPIAARPEASTMLVIGLGGGVALEDVPSSIDAIDVVELEPEVVRANRRIGALRRVNPLEDPRVAIVVNDARNALNLTSKRYDVIASQPSPPWTARALHLFTREFAELAKSRLNENGVFLQWIGGSFVDADLLRSLMATLLDVYENVRLYHAGGATLFLIASEGPLDIEGEIARTGRPLNANLLHYSYLGLNGVEDFAAALLLDEQAAEEFAADAPLSTDDRNTMATDSRTLADGLDPAELMNVISPYDPLLDPESALRRGLGDRLEFAYIASRLLSQGQAERAARLAPTIGDASVRQVATALVRHASGQLEGARESLLMALREDPSNDAARFALIEPELPNLATGRASARIRELADSLTGSAAAVVRGWALAAARDYEGLASLDRELARASVTDLWFPYATQLRADWRTQVVGDTRHAFDAMRMLDRAIVLKPSFDLYVLRAAAADVLGDALAFVETSRRAVHYMNEYFDRSERLGMPIAATELALTMRRLAAWQARLGELRGEADGRVGEVFDLMGALLYRCEAEARSRGLLER